MFLEALVSMESNHGLHFNILIKELYDPLNTPFFFRASIKVVATCRIEST